MAAVYPNMVTKERKRESIKTSEAKTWMKRYINLIGDKMPHNGQIHLPSWETHRDIYLRHKEDMRSHPTGIQQVDKNYIISLGIFY